MSKNTEIPVDQLVADLECATILYVQGINASNDGDAGLSGVQEAILALRMFCAGIGVPKHNLIPLTSMLRAFRDLQAGHTPPLFKPAKIEKKPRLSLEERLKRRIVAMAMEALMIKEKNSDEKKTKEMAARAVARKLEKIGVKLHRSRRSAEPWKVVSRWRDEVKVGVYGASIARSYNKAFERFLTLADSPEKVADELLERLPFIFNPKI